MSRSVKLVVMGVAGAALLYSCAPGASAGLRTLPYLWFLPNPFYRPAATNCPPGANVDCEQQTSSSTSGGSSSASRGGSSSSRSSSGSSSETTTSTPTYSQRGGFGSTGSHSSGSS